MEIKKSYKIRLYPTKGQQVFFNKTMGACRVIYNELFYTLQENFKNNIKNEGLRILDKSTGEVSETGVITIPMLVENPPMDESSIKNIKSSDSMKQEQLIKD